jgi:ATP-dependent protease ClpP protease subunit
MHWNDGNTFIFNDFDDSMEANVVLALQSEVAEQAEKRDGSLNLWINSFGGYAHLVFHIIELVEMAKREGVIVRTIVPSVAFSAGSMLAVTGTPGERYISKTGEHMIHYGRSLGSAEETPKQIERMSEYKRRDFKNTLLHYEKYADVPNLDAEMMDDGFFIPAAKCIKYKLADKYIDKFDIRASS